MEKEEKILLEKTPKGNHDSMKHKHFWIIDSTGLGKCKYCPAKKQFHAERKLKLRPSEISAINNLGSEAGYDPDSWLNTTSHDFEVRT